MKLRNFIDHGAESNKLLLTIIAFYNSLLGSDPVQLF